MNVAKLPHLTCDLPGIGGHIKQNPADFKVQEIPIYEASGEGTHVYFRVVKAGLPTSAAVDRIARHMGVRPREIGVAGLKDAHALTTQIMSLEHVDPEKLQAFSDPQIKIDWTSRHTNKLKLGHLAGNKFTILIRGVGAADMPVAEAIMDVLIRRGAPNYFGHQRFGARGDTDALGAALVRQDLDEFVATLLGRAQPTDPPDCRAARDAFDSDFLQRAMNRWPRAYSNERRALAAYRKRHHTGPAVAAVDKRMKRFYVSAFQSAMFNEVLEKRIETLDQVMVGDLAQKSENNAIFPVEDADLEQPRAERLEISATGPIFGYRCNLATGQPGQIEQQALASREIELEDFRHVGQLKVKGTRRALRFQLQSPEISPDQDANGDFIKLSFSAKPGCYATVVLREIMKNDEAF